MCDFYTYKKRTKTAQIGNFVGLMDENGHFREVSYVKKTDIFNGNASC